MSLRKFVDSEGQEWQTFDVVPRAEERRHSDRRSGEIRLDDLIDRREEDRRLTVGGRSERIAGAGWLCFERGSERRRLSPIPADWLRCSDDELSGYCRSARPVRRSTPRQDSAMNSAQMKSAAD